uniref:Hexosyltransferase n=1 Tax=Syphacia muris TaxID=451379 RepID=A0A0N5AAJ4_9BILA
MIYWGRTGFPLILGLLVGVIFSLSLFSYEDVVFLPNCPVNEPPSSESDESTEHWEVVVKKIFNAPNTPNQPAKVARARFAATELGIREKLVVIMMSQSSLTVALNASIGLYVPRLQLFADSSRIDAELASLPNLTPYRSNGQHAHVAILNSIFNLTLHENYDWFFLIPDTTYVNPFELMRFVNHVNWNRRVAIGRQAEFPNGNKCLLQAGILLSNPAMQFLIQQRHLCNSIITNSDHDAFEMCIYHATNLSCVSTYQGHQYNWWKVDETVNSGGAGGSAAIHDTVAIWSQSSEFNKSLSVSPLLSEADAHALHEHFVRVELSKVDEQINTLVEEIGIIGDEIADGPTWPVGIAPYSRPPNRYHVMKWQYFTEDKIFKSEANQNVYDLEGDDENDVKEVVAAARQYAESATGPAFSLKFIKLRSGYRVFDATRGMDYMLDLEYKKQSETVCHRIHLNRPIVNTQLMHQVPYVKEDTDLTIVIPLGLHDDVTPTRRLLARHARLCQAYAGDSRQTRVVVAVRSISSSASRIINNDLVELKNRCKSSRTETMLLVLKLNSHPVLSAAALDEAVDHFGQNMIYLLLSPYADIQREFLDRVRINTIKHFQVFFPVPFVEFHPQIANASEYLQSKASTKDFLKNDKEGRAMLDIGVYMKRKGAITRGNKPLVVHKDQGHFDATDFSVCSLYGADFIRVRPKLTEQQLQLDLSSLFLQQSNIHLMRAIEPALRLRFHMQDCSTQLTVNDYKRCELGKITGLATKAQLSSLMLFDTFDEAFA